MRTSSSVASCSTCCPRARIWYVRLPANALARYQAGAYSHSNAPEPTAAAEPADYRERICAYPATIRNSTLLFPAILKNAPCSFGRDIPSQRIDIIYKFDRNESALPAISENLPANRKLQGDTAGETVSLLTAFSATQSGLCERPSAIIFGGSRFAGRQLESASALHSRGAGWRGSLCGRRQSDQGGCEPAERHRR